MDSPVLPRQEFQVHRLAQALRQSREDATLPPNRGLVQDALPGLLRMIERVALVEPPARPGSDGASVAAADR